MKAQSNNGRPSPNKADIVSQTGNVTSMDEYLLDLIARQPFFKGLAQEHIQKLRDSAVLMQFKPGEWIFCEGDLANRFYLILEGTVELDADTEERGRISIQELGPGDDLGWSWLFPPHQFHFSARAITATRVICFYGSRLCRQCEEDHSFGHALMQRVAQVVINRLQATRRQLVKLATARASAN